MIIGNAFVDRQLEPEFIKDGVTIYGVEGNFGAKSLIGELQIPSIITFGSDQRNGYVYQASTGAVLFEDDAYDAGYEYVWTAGAGICLGRIAKTDNKITRLGTGYPTKDSGDVPSSGGTLVYGKLNPFYYGGLGLDANTNYQCYLPQGFDTNRFTVFNKKPLAIRDHVNEVLLIDLVQETSFDDNPTSAERTFVQDGDYTVSSGSSTRTVAGLTMRYGGVKQTNVLGREGAVGVFHTLSIAP